MPAPVGTLTLVACFPGRGRVNDVIEVWGYNFGAAEIAIINGGGTDRLVGSETVTRPLIGDIRRTLIFISLVAPGTGDIYLTSISTGAQSSRYPFTVD